MQLPAWVVGPKPRFFVTPLPKIKDGVTVRCGTTLPTYVMPVTLTKADASYHLLHTFFGN